MPQPRPESLKADLRRISAAMKLIDLSETLQASAPITAGQLLRNAQEELDKLIGGASTRPDAAGPAC